MVLREMRGCSPDFWMVSAGFRCGQEGRREVPRIRAGGASGLHVFQAHLGPITVYVAYAT